jgi:hypothetical protein
MERWHQFVNKMIMQIRKRLDYDVNRGIVLPEPITGIYDTLTNNIWMTIVFWVPQQVLKGQPINELLFKQSVWSHISPYFTPKGMGEFEMDIQPTLAS